MRRYSTVYKLWVNGTITLMTLLATYLVLSLRVSSCQVTLCHILFHCDVADENASSHYHSLHRWLYIRSLWPQDYAGNWILCLDCRSLRKRVCEESWYIHSWPSTCWRCWTVWQNHRRRPSTRNRAPKTSTDRGDFILQQLLRWRHRKRLVLLRLPPLGPDRLVLASALSFSNRGSAHRFGTSHLHSGEPSIPDTEG